jgi:DNA-binding winged helix-turn-helix (wHTH) protein
MIYIFGDYEFDDTRYELRRAGESVAIEPKAFKVLAHLIQHRDRVVTKAELLERLWPGVFVSESALTRCLARVRQALHDEGPGQRVIRTIRGHGYRFVASIATRATEPANTAVSGTSRSRTVVEGQ